MKHWFNQGVKSNMKEVNAAARCRGPNHNLVDFTLKTNQQEFVALFHVHIKICCLHHTAPCNVTWVGRTDRPDWKLPLKLKAEDKVRGLRICFSKKCKMDQTNFSLSVAVSRCCCHADDDDVAAVTACYCDQLNTTLLPISFHCNSAMAAAHLPQVWDIIWS